MPNPGAFRGSRFTFMVSQKAEYARAVLEDFKLETLMRIQRRYFKRYPIDLPHDVEPTAEHLASVDDDGPDEDLNSAELTNQMVVPMTGWAPVRRGALIAFRKIQIARWLEYQYCKDNDLLKKKPGSDNPYTLMFAKFSGKKLDPPRKRSARNTWRLQPDARAAIEHQLQLDISQAKAKNQPIPSKALINRRDVICRELFQQLPKSERDEWEAKSVADKAKAMEEFDEYLTAPPSTDPQDRQRAIEALPAIILPILDYICAATGLKSTLMLGGPMPALGGQINVMSIHSGKTTGDIPLNFGQAERESYEKVLVPIFWKFLKKCFTPEECRASALSPGSALPLSILDPGSEDDPYAIGTENPYAYIHPGEIGLKDTPAPTNVSTAAAPQGPSTGDGDSQNPFPFGLRRETEWSPSPRSDDGESVSPSPYASRSNSPAPVIDSHLLVGSVMTPAAVPSRLTMLVEKNPTRPEASAPTVINPVLEPQPRMNQPQVPAFQPLTPTSHGLQDQPATIPSQYQRNAREIAMTAQNIINANYGPGPTTVETVIRATLAAIPLTPAHAPNSTLTSTSADPSTNSSIPTPTSTNPTLSSTSTSTSTAADESTVTTASTSPSTAADESTVTMASTSPSTADDESTVTTASTLVDPPTNPPNPTPSSTSTSTSPSTIAGPTNPPPSTFADASSAVSRPTKRSKTNEVSTEHCVPEGTKRRRTQTEKAAAYHDNESRCRKVNAVGAEVSQMTTKSVEQGQEQGKRGRGRPRKSRPAVV